MSVQLSRRGCLASCALLLAGLSTAACTLTPRSPGPPPKAMAPPFDLPSHHSGRVSLKQLLADGNPAVVMFYRGYW